MEINETSTISEVKEFLSRYMHEDDVECFINRTGARTFNEHHQEIKLADQPRLIFYNIMSEVRKYN